MKRIIISAILSFAGLLCAGQTSSEEIRLPIIRYDPATYLSDIEEALSETASGKYAQANPTQFADADKGIIGYLSSQDAFIIHLTVNDAKFAPKLIGIKDKEKGYLKYLNVEEELIRYSLDVAITDLFGSLEEYVATWPEDQRHLFYDDPQGLYTFPDMSFAIDVAGWENSKNPDNPAKFKAAVSYLRTRRPEWNDDTWANDSTEIVKYSDSHTGIIVDYETDIPKFEGQDADYFSKWVHKKLTYPDAALEDAATGRVTLMFKIDMFGNLEDVKVLRRVHPALDSIAFNVVSSSPEWTPANDLFGNPRSAIYTFPVIFTAEMMFKAFITKMYNEKLYADYDFLQKHCSPELLKKLQDAYPYDSDEAAYATWFFRSGQQDSKPGSDGKTMLVDVNSDGEWYTYTALDMGWNVTNRLRMTNKDGKIIIEDMDIVAD